MGAPWVPCVRSRKWRVVASACLIASILSCPLLIPAGEVGLRAFSAFVSGDISFKVIDYLRVTADGNRLLTLREYVTWLIPFPVLSAVYPDHKRRLVRRDAPGQFILTVMGGAVCTLVALATLRVVSGLAAIQSSFVLNHLVMLLTFVLAVESLSRVGWGLERLAGYDTRPIIDNVYRSRTVAEFWYRYNYRIHEWLYRNVFRPCGGRQTPARAVLLVFFVSGLFHEIMFAMATSRLTGYQFAFFMIQAPAVLASGRLQRLALRGGMVGVILAHGATILFMAVTSILFFNGVSRVFQFLYVSRSPLP